MEITYIKKAVNAYSEMDYEKERIEIDISLNEIDFLLGTSTMGSIDRLINSIVQKIKRIQKKDE